MNLNHFFKTFSVHFLLISLMVGLATPVLYQQIWEIVYNLNLDKNREQAERLATLASIDLERGVPADKVLEKVQKMLENTPQSDEHFACIVEDENKVIAHPKPSNVNKDVTGWVISNELEEKTFTQSAGEGVPFGGIQTRLDGSQDISYQIPISTKPWSVCVHTKLYLIDEQTLQIMEAIAWVLLPLLFFLLLIIGIILSKQPISSNPSVTE